jgi:hypothetical protein
MPDLGAAVRFYRAYRYTIVTIVNGAQPHTVEAELWWDRPSEKEGWRMVAYKAESRQLS